MYIPFYKGKLKLFDDLEKRCKADYIQAELKKLLPEEDYEVTSVSVNRTGIYDDNPLKDKYPPQYAFMFKVENLPDYVEIVVTRKTQKGNPIGVIIWAPFSWNERFSAVAGAGNRTGGYFQLGRPDDFSRGMAVPSSLMNGFITATTDGGVYADGRWWLDEKTSEIREDLMEEWIHIAMHKMSVVTKAVAKIIYGEYPKYSYLHGASGGGRQSLMEAQRYPEDFNGIWASCPAINWNRFIVGNLWALAVINETGAKLTAKKVRAFNEAVQNKYGGKEAYYNMLEIPVFDAYSLLGTKTEDGEITEADCEAMKEIWQGATDENGRKCTFTFRTGLDWLVDGPAATGSYFVKRENGDVTLRPFSLMTDYAACLDRNFSASYENVTKEKVIELCKKALVQFPHLDTSEADLSKFEAAGAKLVIDHGTGDCLVPCEGTLDYYERAILKNGGKEKTKQFFRLFFNAGDGHGNCYSFGAGASESQCMLALMNWVENGVAPETLKGYRVDEATKKVIEEKTLKVY